MTGGVVGRTKGRVGVRARAGVKLRPCKSRSWSCTSPTRNSLRRSGGLSRSPELSAACSSSDTSLGDTLRTRSPVVVCMLLLSSGAATDVHIDSGLLSFTIALNAPSAYDGGGTWFESVDKLVEMPQGHVTFRPGHVRHQGKPLTRGTRYMIGGFIMREDVVEHGRRSIERGVAALGGAVVEGNFAAASGDAGGAASPELLAVDALEHAVLSAPRVASAQLNLGTARQRAMTASSLPRGDIDPLPTQASATPRAPRSASPPRRP